MLKARGEELHDGFAAEGVTFCGEDSAGFVHHDGERRRGGAERFAVYGDFVFWAGFCAKLGDYFAVHGNAAVSDEFFRGAARAEACGGDEFLNAV